ncbi:MAG: TonB-dependent receptor plug domain-containing protein, partial [Xanthomonadales bacterium]|nr:TonB-dependent receptor plug domain-containing protein [Xanthomonadales bacterium]
MPKTVTLGTSSVLPALSLNTMAECNDSALADDSAKGPKCAQLEPLTIFGTAQTARDVAGGASVLTSDDPSTFETTDVQRALRRVPGLSLQIEDGWALRPNIGIRGTPTERSSRITLLEDSVLIAPAPYSAPADYYFPSFGRIHSAEVLKANTGLDKQDYIVSVHKRASQPVMDSLRKSVALLRSH